MQTDERLAELSATLNEMRRVVLANVQRPAPALSPAVTSVSTGEKPPDECQGSSRPFMRVVFDICPAKLRWLLHHSLWSALNSVFDRDPK